MDARTAKGWRVFLFSLVACGSSPTNQTGDGGPTSTQEGGGMAGDDAGGGGSSEAGGQDAGGMAEGATSSGDAGLPPLDPNVDTSTLSTSQLGELCDWAMSKLGGYGTTNTCSSTGGGPRSVQNPSDQAMCISTSLVFSCPVTVGQYESCILAQVPSGGCAFPPACSPLVCGH